MRSMSLIVAELMSYTVTDMKAWNLSSSSRAMIPFKAYICLIMCYGRRVCTVQ